MAEQSKTVDAALRLLSLLGAEADGEPPPPLGRARSAHRASPASEASKASPATEAGARLPDSSAASFARRLRLSRTAVGRILATLEAHGLARRTGRGWDLGFGVLTLAGRIEPVLRAAARPAIEDLATRFGETAVLALRDGAEAVAVDQVVASHHLVQVRYRPGSRLPLDRAAHGRALLAEGAAAGHVVRDGEPEAGVKGVAAPIFGGSGAVASIGLVAPTHRFPPEADVVAAVRAAARLVTTAMGETQPTDAADEGDDHAVLPARG